MSFTPSEVSATVGQEVRVDLSTAAIESLTEAMLTVAYDPKQMEFRRVGPGAAAISAHALDGQVMLTVRRQGSGTGETVLATLFFQAKTKGDATVTMEAAPSDGGPPPRAERAVIHVQ